MQVSQKLLHLINRYQPGIKENGRDGMPEEVRIDALRDASGAGARRDDGLDRTGGVARMPVALEQEPPLTPLEMCAQFIR